MLRKAIMNSSVSPLLRASIFSISPKQRSKESRTGVGFVIYADQATTLGLTARHVVKDKTDYLATFHDQKTVKLHFQAADIYWDFALISIPTEKIGQTLPALSLTGKIPALNSSLLCFGYPQNRSDDQFGGELTRSEPPTEGLFARAVEIKNYAPQGDLRIEPALPFGFSGSPVMHANNVVGIARYTRRLNLVGDNAHSTGPSSSNILWALYNWGQGITHHTDQTRSTIDPAIRESLLKIAKGI